MNTLIECWLESLGAGVEPPVDLLDFDPKWLVRLAARGEQHAPYFGLSGARLIPPNLSDLRAALEGAPLVIGSRHFRNYDEKPAEFEIVGELSGTAPDIVLSVEGQPLGDWLECLVDRDADAPREWVAAAAVARTVRAEFKHDLAFEGVQLARVKSPPAPAPNDAAETLTVSPHAVRLHREKESLLVLAGWWLSSAARLDNGDVAALTWARDEMAIDREHPDIGHSQGLVQSIGSGRIKAPSNGILHIVRPRGGYEYGIRIDADTVSSTPDGAWVFVRRAAFRAGQWGTIVFASVDGKLTLVAKLEADIGDVFVSEGRVFGTAGFEVHGLIQPKTRWTPRAIHDSLVAEKAPPPSVSSLTVEGSGLELALVEDRAPSVATPAHGGQWAGDPSPAGDVVACNFVGPQFEIWITRADGSRIDLGLGPVSTFTYGFAGDSAYLTVKQRVLHVDLPTGTVTDFMTLPLDARDLLPVSDRFWALLGVHEGDAVVVRYDRAGDDWVTAEEFPIFGMDGIFASPDGRLLLLTIQNAPPEVAITQFVAVDRSGQRRFLGSISKWCSAFWVEDGHLYLTLEKTATYRIANLDEALDTARTKQPEPFLALVYDVPGHYGQRAFFPRYDADFGYIDADNKPITRFQFTSATAFENGHARVRTQGGRYWGLINASGELTTPAHYAWIGPEEDGLRRVARGKVEILDKVPSDALWGVIDPDSKTIIEPIYKMILDPTEGRIIAQRDDRQWVILDVTGAEVAGPFTSATPFSEGLAAAETSDGCGLIDPSGAWRVEPKYGWALEPREGRAGVRDADGWFYIDTTTGEAICAERYTARTHFKQGFACVAKGDRWFHLGHDGKRLTGDYQRTYWFNDGLAPVQLEDEVWAYVNRNGDLIGADTRWSRTFDASEGIGIYKDQDPITMGYVGSDGQVIIGGLSAGHRFHEGVAAAALNGRWGLLERSGEWRVEPQFEELGPLRDSRARVKVGDLWGFIDGQGEMVVEPQYGTPQDFYGTRAVVRRKR